MRTLVVWHNLNNDTYYYKFINTLNSKYTVGYINCYNHKIILIIESSILQPTKNYVSLRYCLLTPIIYWLNKLLKFLEKIRIQY